MGYPIAKSAAVSAPAPALSNPGAGINSVANMFRVPLVTPANDLTKLAKPLRRAIPALRAINTAIDLYNLFNPKNPTVAANIGCSGGGGVIVWGSPSCGSFLTNFKQGVLYQDFGFSTLISWGVAVYPLQPPNPPFTAGPVTGRYQINVPKGDYAWKLGGQYAPVHKERPLPEEIPWLNPFDLPIAKPVPDYKPVPPWISPHRPNNPADPSPLPQPRPVPRPRPQPDPFEPIPRPPGTPPVVRPPPRPAPRPNPGPSPQPGPGPGVDPTPQPNPQPLPGRPGRPLRPNPKPSEIPKIKRKPPKVREKPKDEVTLEVRPADKKNPKPPPKGTREAKVRAGAAVRLLWGAINFVTEARDLLKSFHDALPDHLKTRTKRHGVGKFSSANAPTVQQMGREVYEALGRMSAEERATWFNKAIGNVIADQLKDYVFGKAGQAVAKGSKLSGRPVGYGAGPAL